MPPNALAHVSDGQSFYLAPYQVGVITENHSGMDINSSMEYLQSAGGQAQISLIGENHQLQAMAAVEAASAFVAPNNLALHPTYHQPQLVHTSGDALSSVQIPYDNGSAQQFIEIKREAINQSPLDGVTAVEKHQNSSPLIAVSQS